MSIISIKAMDQEDKIETSSFPFLYHKIGTVCYHDILFLLSHNYLQNFIWILMIIVLH